MIQLREVSQTFNKQNLFQNLSLELKPGDRLAVLGPSGSGKSVLLKIIAGLISPSSGKVLINNKDINLLDRDEKNTVIQKMGMLFQKNALFDSLSVAQNLSFPLQELSDLSSSEIEQKIKNLLDSVGILPAKDLYPDEISGGMQKRLGVARAIALNPDCVLYDDPTAGLDPITSRKIIDLIKNLHQEKSSVLVAVTNDVNRAFQVANRFLVLLAGAHFYFETEEALKNCTNTGVYNFLRGISSFSAIDQQA